MLVFKPFIPHLANPQLGWLRLAMSSTLAGNLTIFGSVADLIVVEQAKGVAQITFREYFTRRLPITILTLAIGILWLR